MKGLILMTERVHTGGRKEFRYSKGDLKGIESQDTESTAEFKESYKKWVSQPRWLRKLKRFFGIVK